MLLWWKTSFPQSLRFGFWIVLLKRHWLGHIKPDYSPTLALATLRKESESTSKTIMAASPNRKLWWGMLGFSGSRLDEWSSWNCRHVVNGLLITWSIWYCQYRANFTRSKLDSFLLIFMAEFRALCSECATFCKRKAAGFCSSWARAALKTANISAHLWGPPIEYGNPSDHLVDSWMGSPMQWVVGFSCEAQNALFGFPLCRFGIHEAMTFRLEYLFAIGKPLMLGSKNEIPGWKLETPRFFWGSQLLAVKCWLSLCVGTQTSVGNWSNLSRVAKSWV